MAGVNKVIILGRLGDDPEVRKLNNGGQVVNLSVATSESWKDRNTGEKREKTEWHRVVIWNENIGNIAADYLRKGSEVYLEGKLETRKWQDQSGNDKYATEIILQGFDCRLQLIGGRSNGGGDGGGRNDRGDDRGRGDNRGGNNSRGNSNRNDNRGGGNNGGGGYGGGGLDDDIPFSPNFQ